MQKIVVYQSPAFLYEVAPIFYKELNKLNYFDKFYLATDKQHPYGLGGNVQVVASEQDLGWEGNLKKVLEQVSEEFFVMMCDDHVAVTQTEIDLDKYFKIMAQTPRLGRLQLSPPTLNYARFLRAHGRPVVIPDDSRDWYEYDKRYRWHLNFQPSIWRKDFLLDVIEGGGNKSQLEIRASERARKNPKYVSGYIGQYAVRYENFYASCQVHHTDPDFHRKKRRPHYREAFMDYAVKHNIQMDPTKRVHVRRAGFSASVPSAYYLQNYGNDAAFQKYAIKRNPISHFLFRLSKRVRTKISHHITWSGT